MKDQPYSDKKPYLATNTRYKVNCDSEIDWCGILPGIIIEAAKKNNRVPLKNLIKFKKKSEDITTTDKTIFWQCVNSMTCYDRSEGFMSPLSFTCICKNNRSAILLYLDHRILPNLEKKLLPIRNRISTSETNWKNFLTFIAFKGKDFYDLVIESPSVCLYIKHNYYPIYTWLYNL